MVGDFDTFVYSAVVGLNIFAGQDVIDAKVKLVLVV